MEEDVLKFNGRDKKLKIDFYTFISSLGIELSVIAIEL